MKSIKEFVSRKEAERLDFPECWEEVDSKEWIHLLWLRQQLIERKGITLDDIRRNWCAFVLQNRGLKTNNPDFWLLVNQLADTLNWMWRKEQKRVIRRIILDIRILKKRRASNLYVYVVVFVENRVMEAVGNLPVDCQEVRTFNFL